MTHIALLVTTPQVLVVDLFSSDDPIQPSRGKRPLMEGDEPNERNVCVKHTEDEKFELALRESRLDEKMR